MRGRGELEPAAIEVLWRATTPCSLRAVHDTLADPELAYTTVMTVLDRLSMPSCTAATTSHRLAAARRAVGGSGGAPVPGHTDQPLPPPLALHYVM